MTPTHSSETLHQHGHGDSGHDHSSREVKRIIPIQKKVLELEEEYKKLTDAELQAKTPEFKERLKNGENVMLENGAVVNSRDVVGPAKKGMIITILGDTNYCKASIDLAMGADVLVHEATFDHQTEDLAASYGHSTNTEAATIAKNAHVRALILNHISARFLGKDLDRLLVQAKQIFENTYIAADFSQYALKDLMDINEENPI